MSTATFRFSTDILQRLGEELITSFDQGIIELVKNSYDADASLCSIEFIDTQRAGGTVVISDDGYGMSIQDIQDGWLVLGRSRKVPSSRTPRDRLPAGSKGLGRLGALRMGQEVLLTTQPLDEPGVDYSLRIRWADFASSDVVEDVSLAVQHSESELRPGTRIAIRGLKTAASEREVRQLARELLLLTDPFGDPAGFKTELVAPAFKELEELVNRAYFDDSEFRLVARLDEHGRASAKVLDRSGTARWTAGADDLGSPYQAPPATFELWVFLLARDSFAGRSATVGEVRRWLAQVGGVHLYHRGLRVRPYGDEGHDWLDMNLRRAQSPELRPSTNTSIGRVTVLDASGDLLQRTDRTGFIDNEAFRDLRRFAVEALEWMQARRLDEREEHRAEDKRQSDERAKKADKSLKQEIDKLEPAAQQSVSRAARELESARASERDRLRDELTLYKTLASVGTAVSVFAHEIEGPATELTTSVEAVERRAQKALAARYATTVGKQVEAVKRSAKLVARFATLPLGMLKKSKRRRTLVDANEVIRDTLALLGPYLVDARVDVIRSLSNDNPHVQGSVADIEAIMSNLLTNAVKAFKIPNAGLRNRTVAVRSSVAGDRVLIGVLDNGPGIRPQLADRVWLPGITSDENGTGLGLTIVRDTVVDLGGKARAIAQGELGGAEFIIDLPLAGSPQ